MGLISLLVTAGLMAAYGRRARTVVVRDPLADAMAEYERRLADTDKDVARGTLTAAEADVAKAEIGRQLLSQKKVLEKTDGEAVPSGQTLAQNRGVIDAIVLLTIAVLPAVAGVLYWQLGSPGFADQPLAQRVTPANPQTQ
ncbi:MAG: c-type cytochrome biogenesis protein CcmI, partial [Pseudomonadota bacterium]